MSHSSASSSGTSGGGGASAHGDLTGVTSDQHHAQVHTLDGADHTVSGLTTGHVLRATGATTFAFGQPAHADLGSVGIDDHHARDHTLTGSTHTASGLTTGHVLQATGATTFAFASADGLDGTAIHDNVSGEISAIAEKTTPVGADLLIIEDSAASNAKKRVQITNLPGGGGGPDVLTTKGDLHGYNTDDARIPIGTNDFTLTADSTEALGLKWAATNDSAAIHDNVSAEISTITEKTAPVSGDLLVIEDSAASNAKKRLQIGNLPGFQTLVDIHMTSGVTSYNPTADHNGSGTAWDPRHANLMWHIANSAGEGESNTYSLWCTEIDDPKNPSTTTVRYRATLTVNDQEAITFIKMSGQWYIALFENITSGTRGQVRIYEAPDVQPGQTLVTETPIGGSNWLWDTTSETELDNNIESMRWNQWDGRLYFLTPRGGNEDNNNERQLVRSADWRTSTPTSMPATTSLADIGEVVTRPEGSSPVGNGNGDIDFLGEHVLLIAGVGDSTPKNGYIMYVKKNTDEDWDDVIPTGGGTNYPDVLTYTGISHECIAVNKATGVVWAGPENSSNANAVFTVQLTEGPNVFPADPLPTSKHESQYLVSDDSGGWQVINTPEIIVESFADDPDSVTDWGPTIRAARDYGDTLGHPYTLRLGIREYAYTTTETVSVQDGETGSSSNFEVCVQLPEGCTLKGSGSGHGRSGGEAQLSYAATVLGYEGSTLHDAILLHYTSDGNPDWRGGGAQDMHFTDNSTARDRVLHGIYSQGANFQKYRDVSISHIERNNGWGMWIDVVRNAGNTEDEPTQYGTLRGVNIWRCDNGIRIDGRNPDWKFYDGSVLRHEGDDDVATSGKIGIDAATNKLTIVNYEIQFHDIELQIRNHSANLGKHITCINIHFEADTGAMTDDFEACVKMTGTSGQDELPLFIGCEVGNGAKYTDFFKFTDVYDFRIRDFRIRDSDWLVASSTKIEHTNSTGTVDGTSV